MVVKYTVLAWIPLFLLEGKLDFELYAKAVFSFTNDKNEFLFYFT